MRWTVTLPSPSLVAAPGDEPASLALLQALPPTLRLGPDAAGRTARVWIRTVGGGDVVEFAVLAEGVAGVTARPAHPEWYFRDHLVVFLNPGNDHGTQWLYSLSDKGEISGAASLALPGEEPGETRQMKLADPPKGEGFLERLAAHRFFGVLRLPARAVWPGQGEGVPAGFAVKVGFHEECVPQPLGWPEQLAWAVDLPLSTCDLYRTAPRVSLERLTFLKPAWGGAPSIVLLQGLAGSLGGAPGGSQGGSGSPAGPAGGRVQARLRVPGAGEYEVPAVTWEAREGRMEARLEVTFPSLAKWAPDPKDTAWLEIEILEGAAGMLWRGGYPFGFDCGVIVRERYGPREGRLVPRPAPGDPAFSDRYREYILSRLPDYVWSTTDSGAPSDFFLRDRVGQAHLDLVGGGVLDRVADLLVGRFPDWQDALCAAAMWCYHPCVTRHSGTWSGVAGAARLETVLRLGGCFCGDCARVVAALAEKIGQRLGVRLEGYTLGLRGHIATLVGTPLGRVVIDGMHGVWYHTLDGGRLATLEELRVDRGLVERVWCQPRAHGHEFFFQIQDQIIRPWREGTLSWPPLPLE